MGLRRMLVLLAIGLALVVGLGVYVVVVELHSPTTEEAAARDVLVFPPADDADAGIPRRATRLEIRRGDQTTVIEKTGARTWRLRRPVDARADRSAVLAVLTDLKTLRVESSTTSSDLSAFGLAPPRVLASFWLGEERHQVAIGATVPGAKRGETKVYIRADDRGAVYVVDGALAAKLDRAFDAFRDRRVFDVGLDKASAVRITSPDRKLLLQRREGIWHIVEPVEDFADPSAVGSLLTKLAALKAEGYVTEDAADLADYGLDEPALTCELTVGDGQTMTLLVGRDVKDSRYAKRGEEPAVFTLKEVAVAAANVTPEQVRQRRVVDVAAADVTSIEIESGDRKWAVARGGADEPWRLVQPKQAGASQEAVAAFLGHLRKLRVSRWVDDPWATAHEFFRKPAAVVTLSRGTDTDVMRPPVRVAFSSYLKTAALDGRFVQRVGQRCLLYVSSKPEDAKASLEARESVEAASAVAKTLEAGYLAFLDRRIFDFDPEQVTTLTVERDDAMLVCEKAEAGWRLALPVEMDADPLNVGSLIGAMANLRAADYVAEKPDDLMALGLLDPDLTLTVTVSAPGHPPAEKTLLVGTPRDGRVHAMEKGGSLVFTLSPWDARALHTEPISTSLGDWQEADVVGLSLERRGEHPVVLERGEGGWRLTWPRQAPVLRSAAGSLVGALHGFRIPRYVDYDGTTPRTQYGLDPPSAVLSIRLKGETSIVLEVGKEAEREERYAGRYAALRGRRQVFVMPQATVEGLLGAFASLGHGAKDE